MLHHSYAQCTTKSGNGYQTWRETHHFNFVTPTIAESLRQDLLFVQIGPSDHAGTSQPDLCLVDYSVRHTTG